MKYIIYFLLFFLTLADGYAGQDHLKTISDFASSAKIKYDRGSPEIPKAVSRSLEKLRIQNRTDHIPFLVEYGLRVHLQFLEKSGIARELSINKNTMNTELFRLLKIQKFTTAHEGGWLNRQFTSEFDWRSYSSYQVYVWLLEAEFLTYNAWPNAARIHKLMKSIHNTGRYGLGGNGTCHYGCL